MPVSVRRILHPVELLGADDVVISRCQIDVAEVRPGDVFVALSGLGHDPQVVAYQAASRGAAAVVTEQFLPELGVPQAIVRDAGVACALLAQALEDYPSRQMPVIAFVGGKGAVVAQTLVQRILEDVGVRCAVADPLAYGRESFSRTSLWGRDPRLPSRWLSWARQRNFSCALVAVRPEVAFRGSLAGVCFEALVLGDPWGSGLPRPAGSCSAKWLSLCDQIKPTGLAILSQEHPFKETILCHLEVPSLTVGMGSPAEIRVNILEESLGSQLLLLRLENEVHVVRLHAVGRQAALAAAMASGVGSAWGVPLVDLLRSIAAVRDFPGYFEPLTYARPCPVFVDNVTTLGELVETLEQLRPVTRGRLFCTTLFSFWEGGGKNPLAAGKATMLTWLSRFLRYADWIGVVSPGSHGAVDEAGSHAQLLRALRNCGGNHSSLRIGFFFDLDEALSVACRKASSDDVLLVAKVGDPAEDYTETGARRKPLRRHEGV